MKKHIMNPKFRSSMHNIPPPLVPLLERLMALPEVVSLTTTPFGPCKTSRDTVRVQRIEARSVTLQVMSGRCVTRAYVCSAEPSALIRRLVAEFGAVESERALVEALPP